MGGVDGPVAAIEFLLAGASAVAVGMYNFIDPFTMKKTIEGIQEYLISEGYDSVRQIIGLAHGKG